MGKYLHAERINTVIYSILITILVSFELVTCMEVLLRRRGCVRCNTEAATPPQRLHSRGQQVGVRPLRKSFNFDLL